MAALRHRDLLRAFGRSLWLQATWSFQGMQCLGFAYAMDPVLKRLHGDGEERRVAVSRHLEFFNTHPYLASVILGCSIRLEEDGEPGLEETVRRVKNALMGPYGAIGDSLYWGGLKPLLALVALHAAYRGELWAPWLFLGLFTAANVAGRFYGFWQGYRRGLTAVEVVGALNLMAWSRRSKAACAVLLGTLLSSAAGPTPLGRWELSPWLWAALAWPIALGVSWVVGKGARPAWLVYLAVLASGAIVACT